MESQSKALTMGDAAPPFSLNGTDGKLHSLADAKGANAVLIIFMCNHCPYVKAKFETLKAIHAEFKDKGLVMIGVNPNDPTQYPEDSLDEMKKFVKNGTIPYLYLQDESQEVARHYGAVCTPDPYLFNSSLKLAYHGRIDNAHGPGKTPSTFDLRHAIHAVLEGKKPQAKTMPSMGCSIKWKY